MKLITVEEVIEECKALPHNKEGYVLTFENGLKVKIKGKEYVDAHKILSDLTPLTFWRSWDWENDGVPTNFAGGLPDEFKEEVQGLMDDTNNAHKDLGKKMIDLHDKIMEEVGDEMSNKELFPYFKKNYPKQNRFLMNLHAGKKQKFWYLIHKAVRPTLNEWPDINTF